jgi:hypothetical protein
MVMFDRRARCITGARAEADDRHDSDHLRKTAWGRSQSGKSGRRKADAPKKKSRPIENTICLRIPSYEPEFRLRFRGLWSETVDHVLYFAMEGLSAQLSVIGV